MTREEPKWVVTMPNKYCLYFAPFRSYFSSQEGKEETTGLYESKRSTKIILTYCEHKVSGQNDSVYQFNQPVKEPKPTNKHTKIIHPGLLPAVERIKEPTHNNSKLNCLSSKQVVDSASCLSL